MIFLSRSLFFYVLFNSVDSGEYIAKEKWMHLMSYVTSLIQIK